MLQQYEQRLSTLRDSAKRTARRILSCYLTLVISSTVLLALGLLCFRQQLSVTWLIVPLIMAVLSIQRIHQNRSAQSQSRRLQAYYERGVRRLTGQWMADSPTGEGFSLPGHPFAADLQLFGRNSLFQFLCTVRTAIGQSGLASYLLSAPPFDEILLRQAAVKELSGEVALRESIALLGELESSQLQPKIFEDWLDLPTVRVSRLLRLTFFVTSTALFALILAAIAQVATWGLAANGIFLILIFHSIAGLVFRDKLKHLLSWLHPMSVEIETLQEGLLLLAPTKFGSRKLRALATAVGVSSQPVRNLSRLLTMMDSRNKEWFYVPSLMMLVGTQLYLAIEQWRARHGKSLRAALSAWAEFEALNALANYTYENPGNAFPTFSTGAADFDAKSLGHPLLPASCVRNDVRLGSDVRFYLVSGSNMSGKSTLLRAIGLNVVLAYCGAPARAQSLSLSRLLICASLSVVDSLASGTSKFMAEVDRLRYAIEAAAIGEPVLFLIDEIFSGTNSRDRLVAAEAVVRTLLGCGAIGMVSTHDLALTGIACPELHGINVHTGSKDGTDPMDFDYLLKPGVTQETNALAIARLAGVPFV